MRSQETTENISSSTGGNTGTGGTAGVDSNIEEPQDEQMAIMGANLQMKFKKYLNKL
ncbi:MAG: hypothetical protein ACNI3H_12565 [Halarcobacter ebronensis]